MLPNLARRDRRARGTEFIHLELPTPGQVMTPVARARYVRESLVWNAAEPAIKFKDGGYRPEGALLPNLSAKRQRAGGVRRSRAGTSGTLELRLIVLDAFRCTGFGFRCLFF
jgi:hypothetical protein